MSLSIVLTGRAGAGKTTLARAIEDKLLVPYCAVETQKYMPECIKSHLDAIKVGVTDPQVGIDFQTALITERFNLFKSLHAEDKSYVSDRSVFDSLVYYGFHNSMFDTEHNKMKLSEIADMSVRCTKLFVVLNPCIDETEDNSVRLTDNLYQELFAASLQDQLLKSFSKLGILDEEFVMSLDHDGLCDCGTCHQAASRLLVSSTGQGMLFINEQDGFIGVNTKLELIKEALNTLNKHN